MFRNHFKIALRNLARNKVYSLINIFGLSVGLTCAMLILLYVKDEASYDKFHSNVSHIYRIVRENESNGQKYKDPNTGYLQGPSFARNVPGIRSFVRVQSGTENIKLGNDVQSQDLLYADSSFFSTFTFPLIEGDRKNCLKEPNSIVLSDDEAKKRFGTADAIGKLVMIKEDDAFKPYTVTAVAKRSPQNSSIQFNILLPFKESAEDAANKENWFNFYLNTFVVLDDKAVPGNVVKNIQRYYVKDAGQIHKTLLEKYGNEFGGMDTYFLQPFTDIHLSTQLPAQNGLVNNSNPLYSYILSGIALFVLLIACINFINLTVARSVRRAKEIGIRKVIGSGRRQLILQFMGESYTLCGIAFVLALILTQSILPVFNTVANKALSLSYLFDANLIATYISLFLCTGFLAGFYPALVLSGYRPVDTLYSRFNLTGKNYLQKTLVVVQFALASSLIIGTFIIYSQFNFLTTTDVGYDDSHLVMVNNLPMKHSEAAVFKTELKKYSNIVDVSAKNGGFWGTIARLANDSSINFAYETIDEAFIPMMHVQLAAGRNFSVTQPSDSINNVLVNETFVKKAGWKNPVGETVNFFYNNKIYNVIGVVKDYHYQPITQEIQPQLFTMKNSNSYGTFFIKIKAGTEAETLKQIQKTFRQFYPTNPYSYTFLDETNRNNYEAELKWKRILLFGAILTIFISCIGLFGLSVLSAEKRTKEIGIRKVLGASINSIVTILSRDFVSLVLIALLISIPSAWLAGNKWLQNYPYRISMGWSLFVWASVLVVGIALITVSFQAIKAAISNPVKSLRTE